MSCWPFRKQPPSPKWAIDLLHMQRALAQRQERLFMALVSIDQDDLDTYAAEFEAQAKAFSASATVLQGYIAQLIAGQATPLPAADETAINQALTDLTAADTAVAALEPPAPAPAAS